MWERKIHAHNGYIVFCTHKRWNLSSPKETPLSQTPKAVQIPRAQPGGFLAVGSHSAEAPRVLHLSICWRQLKVICFPTVIIVENVRMSMCVALYSIRILFSLEKSAHPIEKLLVIHQCYFQPSEKPRTVLHEAVYDCVPWAAPLHSQFTAVLPFWWQLFGQLWDCITWQHWLERPLLASGTGYGSHLKMSSCLTSPNLNCEKNVPGLPELSARHVINCNIDQPIVERTTTMPVEKLKATPERLSMSAEPPTEGKGGERRG